MVDQKPPFLKHFCRGGCPLVCRDVIISSKKQTSEPSEHDWVLFCVAVTKEVLSQTLGQTSLWFGVVRLLPVFSFLSFPLLSLAGNSDVAAEALGIKILLTKTYIHRIFLSLSRTFCLPQNCIWRDVVTDSFINAFSFDEVSVYTIFFSPKMCICSWFSVW